MKKVYFAALLLTVIASVSTCGCAGLSGGPTSPTPTIVYVPLPSAMPTPTPTPGPVVSNSMPSEDVKIIFSPVHYLVLNKEDTHDGMQRENVSCIVVNDGTAMAKNVILVVEIDDVNNNANNPLVYQEFPIGDLARGDHKAVNLVTGTHVMSSMVEKLIIKARWGASGEYYNPTAYPSTGYNTFTLPP